MPYFILFWRPFTVTEAYIIGCEEINVKELYYPVAAVEVYVYCLDRNGWHVTNYLASFTFYYECLNKSHLQ